MIENPTNHSSSRRDKVFRLVENGIGIVMWFVILKKLSSFQITLKLHRNHDLNKFGRMDKLFIRLCSGPSNPNTQFERWDSQLSACVITFWCHTGEFVNSLTAMGAYKTVRIETHSLRFGGNPWTDKKSLDFFNVPKLHPTHCWKRRLPISVPVPLSHSKQVAGEVKLLLECIQK